MIQVGGNTIERDGLERSLGWLFDGLSVIRRMRGGY